MSPLLICDLVLPNIKMSELPDSNPHVPGPAVTLSRDIPTSLPLTMSDTLRPPKEKTMELGGVATGSMKAREEARVQGSMT